MMNPFREQSPEGFFFVSTSFFLLFQFLGSIFLWLTRYLVGENKKAYLCIVGNSMIESLVSFILPFNILFRFIVVKVESNTDILSYDLPLLEPYYHINRDTFEKQYKEVLSGYRQWTDKDHTAEWLVVPENIGPVSV